MVAPVFISGRTNHRALKTIPLFSNLTGVYPWGRVSMCMFKVYNGYEGRWPSGTSSCILLELSHLGFLWIKTITCFDNTETIMHFWGFPPSNSMIKHCLSRHGNCAKCQHLPLINMNWFYTSLSRKGKNQANSYRSDLGLTVVLFLTQEPRNLWWKILTSRVPEF